MGTGVTFVNAPVAVATSSTAPAITSFAPRAAVVGDLVTISGLRLSGVTVVKFNGIASTSITVVSPTSITATIPTGTTTGPVSVESPQGNTSGPYVFTLGDGGSGGAGLPDPELYIDGCTPHVVNGVWIYNTRLAADDIDDAVADDDTRLADARTPTAHAASHTDGADQIANAVAAGSAGLMSGADKTKLDGIEALADVTDDANVRAALAAATAAVAVNSKKITGLAAGDAGGTDASNVTQMERFTRRFRKDPVRLLGSTNGVPTGIMTFGGGTSSTGDRICINTNIASPLDVGIFIANDAGAWTRPDDWRVGDNVLGATIPVLAGTRAGEKWHVTNQTAQIVGVDSPSLDVDFHGGISPSPNGGTVYGDGTSASGFDAGNGASSIRVNGLEAWRAIVSNGTQFLFSVQQENVIGISGPAGYTYAPRRIVARTYDTIHETVASSATPVFNINITTEGGVKEMVLTSDVTSYTVTAAAAILGNAHALELEIIWTQDVTGGWKILSHPGNLRHMAGAGIGLTAEQSTRIPYRWNRLTSTWDQCAPAVILGDHGQYDAPFISTPTFDAANGNYQTFPLNGNVTGWSVADGTTGGQRLMLAWKQSASVAATGQLQCLPVSGLTNNAYFTIPDGYGLTAYKFEYKVDGGFVPTTGTVIDVSALTTAAQVATATAALIQFSPTGISVTGTANGNNVDLVHQIAGALGNQTIINGGGLAGFTSMANGVQGGGFTVAAPPANVLLLEDARFTPSPAAGVISSLPLQWDSSISKWVETGARVQLPLNDVRPHIRLLGSYASSQVALNGVSFDIDGVTPAVEDLVCVSANSLRPTQAGPFIVKAGLWVRPAWFASGSHAAGTMFLVTNGTAHGGQFWKCNNLPGSDIVDVDTLTFGQVTQGGQTIGVDDVLYGNDLGTGVHGLSTDEVILRTNGSNIVGLKRDASGTGRDMITTFTGRTFVGSGPNTTGQFAGVSSKRYGGKQISTTFSTTPVFQVADGNQHLITLVDDIDSFTVPTPALATQIESQPLDAEKIEIIFRQALPSVATGLIHIVGYPQSDNTTIEIGDGVNPSTIFEVKATGGFTPSGGTVVVDISANPTDYVTVADAWVAAILGVGFAALDITAVRNDGLASVALTNNSIGSMGNVPIIVTGASIPVVGMSGGDDGLGLWVLDQAGMPANVVWKRPFILTSLPGSIDSATLSWNAALALWFEQERSMGLGVEYTGTVAIAVNEVIKYDGSETEFAVLLSTDDPSLAVGTAITACASPGDTFKPLLFSSGATWATMLGDGTDIDPGMPVTSSNIVDGRIMQAGTVGVLGISGSVAAAALNDPVRVAL